MGSWGRNIFILPAKASSFFQNPSWWTVKVGALRKAAHLTDGENPAKAAPGTGWLPANTHSARPVAGPPSGTDHCCFGGGSACGLRPIFRSVLHGHSRGQQPVLLKASCWQGKLSACCVGRGPTVLRAIPSQHFELTSNQERTRLLFS